MSKKKEEEALEEFLDSIQDYRNCNDVGEGDQWVPGYLNVHECLAGRPGGDVYPTWIYTFGNIDCPRCKGKKR